jgi:hypothetical protein
MQNSYTSNSLISYLFQDCPILTKFEVEHWLEEGGVQLQEYEIYKETLSKMPKVNFQPTETSISYILELSKSV